MIGVNTQYVLQQFNWERGTWENIPEPNSFYDFGNAKYLAFDQKKERGRLRIIKQTEEVVYELR